MLAQLLVQKAPQKHPPEGFWGKCYCQSSGRGDVSADSRDPAGQFFSVSTLRTAVLLFIDALSLLLNGFFFPVFCFAL